MHSSRMRTARLLTVSVVSRRGRGVCAGGLGCLPRGASAKEGVSAQGEMCAQEGVVCPKGSLPGGVCLGEECLSRRGVSVQDGRVGPGVSSQGGLQRGVCLGCVADTPRPETDTPCGQTDTCENITFANFVCGQ